MADGLSIVLAMFQELDITKTPSQNAGGDAAGNTVAMAFLDLKKDDSHDVLCTMLGFEIDGMLSRGVEAPATAWASVVSVS